MSLSAVPNLPSAGAIPAQQGPFRVAVSGDLDLASGKPLADTLHRAEGATGGVVFDLSGVVSIDALGAQLLLDADRRVRARGDRFELDGVPDNVMRLLVLLGIDSDFEYVGSEPRV